MAQSMQKDISSILSPKPLGNDANSYQLAQNIIPNTASDVGNLVKPNIIFDDVYYSELGEDGNMVYKGTNNHEGGYSDRLNDLADYLHISSSQMPMNIQGKTWGNFQGQLYDVKNPEQNIELGVRILKAIYDAVPDKDIAKIATLWNNTGANKINEYGKRTKDYYINQYWDTSQMTPVLEQ